MATYAHIQHEQIELHGKVYIHGYDVNMLTRKRSIVHKQKGEGQKTKRMRKAQQQHETIQAKQARMYERDSSEKGIVLKRREKQADKRLAKRLEKKRLAKKRK
jgi:hypothetical protein